MREKRGDEEQPMDKRRTQKAWEDGNPRVDHLGGNKAAHGTKGQRMQ